MTISRRTEGAKRERVSPPWSGLMRMASTEPPTSNVAAAWPLSCISTTSSLNGYSGQVFQKRMPASAAAARANRSLPSKWWRVSIARSLTERWRESFTMPDLLLAGTLHTLDPARPVAQAVLQGSWIGGAGWDQNLWSRRDFPDSVLLSAATPEHPVALSRVTSTRF